MWHQIGENALKLNKFLISKYAFEQSLKIDSTYWPSLDNLIVLYYSIGDYSCKFESFRIIFVIFFNHHILDDLAGIVRNVFGKLSLR
jgi:hypothetical protein